MTTGIQIGLRWSQRDFDVYYLQNLTSRIVFEKPEDPLQFMLNEIEKVQKGEKLKELHTSTSSDSMIDSSSSK